jgi:predicted nucleic acid-binding Zn ribbon protein
MDGCRSFALIDPMGGVDCPEPMATYTYETIPQEPGEEPVRFEMKQSMRDEALKVHPETGVPVRRVITGGFGFIGGAKGPAAGGAHQHGSGCGSGFG